MRRLIAVLIVLALLLAIPLTVGEAAGTAELGEMLLVSDPICGEVGEVVKVNFFLYPNLPDGRKLDSLSGTMKFDPEFVTFGAISQVDEEQNLTSLMKGKASSFQYKVNESGELKFAFIDAYGVEAEGFWFQAEFRIEKEGATDFLFNSITYTGIDDNYKTVAFYLEPVSVGGIYTEGQSIPTDSASDATYAPLTPAVETPAPVTPTPKPSNSHSVPQTSTLPTYSAKPTASGIVTPPPAVTSMPVTTQAPQPSSAPTEESQTAAPEDPVAEATPVQNEETVAETPETTDAVVIPVAEEPETSSAPAATDGSPKETKSDGSGVQQPNMLLVIGVIIGIVAVIGLGVLAIILVLKRRKLNDDE